MFKSPIKERLLISSQPSPGARSRSAQALSFVSQFLRVIPRVKTIDIVKDAMLARGVRDDEATARAEAILTRLNLGAVFGTSHRRHFLVVNNSA